MTSIASTTTPMDTLRQLGITPGDWAHGEGRTFERDGQPIWEIKAKSLNTTALRDIAFLITEGWAVSIRAGAQRTINIRITPKETP
jgi:hypothetical protein